jgi:hypothetical protein
MGAGKTQLVLTIAISIMRGVNTTRLLVLLVGFSFAGCAPSNDKPAPPPAETKQAVPQSAGLGYALDLKAATHFQGFAALNQATIAPSADQLVITSSGNDPQLTIPAVAVRPSQFAARIEVTVPADTVVQLYYTTAASPTFVAENVASVTAKAGRSTILFEINDPTFSGSLRFDPGQTAGEYILHSFELFSSEPMSLGAPSGSRSPSP